ncbi:MAG: hypothetical protein AB8B69_17220 [Chitinophagales bacterium]
MEKIKLSFFDTFAYLIPGILVVLSISIAYKSEIKSLSDISTSYANLTTTEILFIFLSAYITGIICNYFGHKLYQIAKIVWEEDVASKKKDDLSKEEDDLNDTEMHVLVRELSPNNYIYLQSWLGLSNMSHNIAVAMIVLGGVSVFKMFYIETENIIEWVMLLIFCIFSVGIFLKRSIKFNNYFKEEIITTIEKLELLKKAKIRN